MKKLKLQLKHLKPEQIIYFDCPENSNVNASQLITGEAAKASAVLCSGWWNKHTGQLWFQDQELYLYQKVENGPIFVERLSADTDGKHLINFHNVMLRRHSNKKFEEVVRKRFSDLWSDKSEQAN